MDLLKEKETVSTIDIVRILNISEATARRDLAYLEKENKIKRNEVKQKGHNFLF